MSTDRQIIRDIYAKYLPVLSLKQFSVLYVTLLCILQVPHGIVERYLYAVVTTATRLRFDRRATDSLVTSVRRIAVTSHSH